MKKILNNIIAFTVAFTLLSSFKFQTKTDFTKLKAVLVVGHHEDGTKSSIEKADKLAEYLQFKGVHVTKFYDDKAEWENIKLASKGAHIFFYRGHGTNPSGNAGGLCIKNTIGNKKILEELKLAPNALVLFKSVCYSAGSSASDDGDIGIKEAVKRVTSYSQPFIKSGAGCYYANNFGEGVEDFLRHFFDGKTAKECFELVSSTSAKIEYQKSCEYDNTKMLGVKSCEWGGYSTRTTYTNGVKKVEKIPSTKEYEVAYVAADSYSIKDLIK